MPITLTTHDLRVLPPARIPDMAKAGGGSSPLMTSATLLHEIPQQVCLLDRSAAQTLLPEPTRPERESKRKGKEVPLPTSANQR